MANMTVPLIPARALVGLSLDGGWKVVELLERSPTATGGCFSQSYRVISADGVPAFLKALDYTDALTNAEDPARILAALTTAYNFERDLLRNARTGGSAVL